MSLLASIYQALAPQAPAPAAPPTYNYDDLLAEDIAANAPPPAALPDGAKLTDYMSQDAIAAQGIRGPNNLQSMFSPQTATQQAMTSAILAQQGRKQAEAQAASDTALIARQQAQESGQRQMVIDNGVFAGQQQAAAPVVVPNQQLPALKTTGGIVPYRR